MDQWLANLSAWLVGLVKAFFTALLGFVHDAVLWAFDGILVALAGLIAAIPAPSFLTSFNLASVLSVLPAYPLYVLQHINLASNLAIVGAAVVFRLTRKAVTAGQW